MEALGRLLLKAWDDGFISGFKVGGRLTLLHRALVGLPIYFIFCSPSQELLVEIREDSKGFSLGRRGLREQNALSQVVFVCKAKLKGGRLGVRSLSLRNKAFLCKWCWCFSSERDSLWKKIIKGKFGEEEEGWRLGVVRKPYEAGVWKEIGK